MRELRSGGQALRVTDLVEIATSSNSAEEVIANLTEAIEVRLGCVVSSYSDAVRYLTNNYIYQADIDDLYEGETLSATSVLTDGCSIVAMHVTELYLDSGSDDYCYMVAVHELP